MTKLISLEDNWKEFWINIKAQGNMQDEFEFLVRNYQEATRGYHNLLHIQETLTDFEEVKELLKNPLAFQMALWYHDVIYDSSKGDNEEVSAKIAKEASQRFQLGNLFGQNVHDLIIVTKGHEPSSNPDSKYLIDIDFGILGKDEKRFLEYEKGIRKEYSQYPNEMYNVGRSQILQSFLDRESLYQTEFFRKKYEENARRNLTNIIKKLQG